MKPFARLVVIPVLTIYMAACGGGSGGGTPTSPTPTAGAPTPAPTPTPSPTPAPTAPSNFGPYTFVFDAGVSVADQSLIGEATRLAHDYFQSALGRTIERPTEIRGLLSAQGCNAGGGGGAAAFTGMGFVTFCVANQGWIQPRPTTKRKIVVHEIYHVMQFERRWLGGPTPNPGAHWIVEGAAEVIGFRGIDAAGLLSYDTARGCQVKEFTDFAMMQPPGLPDLSQAETAQAFSQVRGPMYTVSMTGMDQLLSGRGLTALNGYMDALAGGSAWQTAFQNAFGQSTAAFYAQWPAYRAGLTVPPSYLCGV